MIDKKYDVNTSFDAILEAAKIVHFIGVGGSGMCPLAEILLKEGKTITGTDVDNESDTVNRMRRLGVKVFIGHSPENIGSDVDLVVYTAAIQKDNAELLSAIERGIPTIERSILLGAICRRYPRTIAVCGTHGKTTTTSMITQILVDAQIDPSIVIGGKLPLIGGNGRAGSSDIMVCEACEFVNTFLQITPACAVILNIDADHLEFFGCIENTIESFSRFVSQTSELVIVNGDDANSMKAVEGTSLRVVTFGFDEKNDFHPANIRMEESSHWEFDIIRRGEYLTTVKLNVPGHHNVLNALAAAAAADYAGATADQIAEGLDSFHGAGRRFEIHTRANGITIADDYAHHPAEIEATLKACKEMGFNKVWAVFQPFTYSRTKMHLQYFADVLSIADEVLLTPIMAAREVDNLGVCSEQLQERIDGALLFQTQQELAQYAVAHAQPGDLIITMGCGDIYKCAKMMTKLVEGE